MAQQDHFAQWNREALKLIAKVGKFFMEAEAAEAVEGADAVLRRRKRPGPPQRPVSRFRDGLAAELPPIVSPHRWCSIGSGKLRCLCCGRLVCNAASRAKEEKRDCRGKAEAIRLVLANPRGHSLAAFPLEGNAANAACILACTSCGAWSSVKPIGLTSPCLRTASFSGRRALRWLSEGRRPNDGAGPVGAPSLLHAP